MPVQSLFHTWQRYRTLKTDRISVLPVVLLMPHSACNCRCVMCDIWKGNNQLKQLTEADVAGLTTALKKFGTRQVVFSGGEALLHPKFFNFCAILKKENIKISLLSTGLTLKKNAQQLIDWVDDIIVSLDGDEQTHDAIRNIPGAFKKLVEGIAAIRSIDPAFPIAGRTVIHQLNFLKWDEIIIAAKKIGLDQISFLPADVSSHAFNRETVWDSNRQREILPALSELPELRRAIKDILLWHRIDFERGFIAESPEKIEKIYYHYAACYGLNSFPYKKCNAPWVSTVIEADGTIRPCFFHEPYGNIHSGSLDKIINSAKAIQFRKELDINKNETCMKCVCYLNLAPRKGF
jgi:MoaA/NifB/PqqE/SkfB family radical SAM enzyme